MRTIQLELDESLVALLGNGSDEPLEQTALELMVLELYRRGTISSGKAAQLLGMPKLDFIRHASALGIPYISMTDEEWDAERRTIDSLWPR